ncbi:hypothetical protein N7462_005582 [Penicillium macrosclerotiorum]|uniref:uncharacterized protein n=1 Tax=Penicillium macrosclerotiorum TaxID=303699 RepID=UPI002547B79B|nr:uncharacterized protein N7462_005582 [Penicillium macrosclerotiorum]KAJ5682417.1 hypothetical protein N7462_005582 [Penicillium macrosclerotiorum]
MSPETAKLSLTEAYHWSRGAALLNKKLSVPIPPQDRDAVWAAAAMLGIVSMTSLEAATPEEAWPLKTLETSDLNWVDMSHGKEAVYKATNPMRPDSVFWPMRDEYLAMMAKPSLYEIQDMPQELVKLCELDELSTPTESPYFNAVSLLTRLWYVECNQTTMVRFLQFLNFMDTKFQLLLHTKDPRALLILAYWHADGAVGKRCAVMPETKFHVSDVAQPGAIASWIPLKIPADEVNAEERLSLPPGNYSRSTVASPLDQRSGFHTPVSREQEYSPVTGQDSTFDTSIDSLPDSSALGDLRRSQTADHHGPESQHLSPNDMIAPVSAVHSMSVNLLDSNHIFMDNSSKGDGRGDIIARGIVSEENARIMYERFIGGSKNFLPLFDPIRDTFDSIRSRSLFCFTVIIYLASRAVIDLRSDTHMQRVLQDEAQRLAEDSFFERPTKLETVQGMILLAAYSEKTWFSTALILRTALDSGLEKSLDTLLSQENLPRSSLSASMADRQLVWQTRTWLISFTLELDVASGTGRKSRIGEVDVMKLRKFLDYPLSLPCDMRTVCIIELHQLRGHSRIIIENSTTVREIISTELPTIMTKLQNWWTTWDEIHNNNGFHAGAFQRSSLKLMLLYARIFVLCASLARIQKLQPSSSNFETEVIDQNVMNLWKSLVSTIMDQLAFLIGEPSYRCQFPWAPTYPALTIAFVTTFALRIARWRPNLIDQDLLLERAEKICDFLKQPPYPDIHRTVSIFVNYARALIASQRPQSHDRQSNDGAEGLNVFEQGDGPVPSYRGPESPMQTAPPLAHLEDPRYSRNGTAIPNDKDPSMVTMPGGDAPATTRPPLPRLPDTMDVPTWTMSNSIADSFGLFEEGQNDIFDFLPMMPSIPQ